MYLQELLEVAVGLVFIYILLSMVCMQVQEWLASLFRWRAENLEDGLREMLADEALSANWLRTLRKIPVVKSILRAIEGWSPVKKIIKPVSTSSWVDILYAHPLIRSLSQPGTRPSYIPARNFALVLFDMVMTAGTEASIIQQTLYRLRAQIPDLTGLRAKERPEFETSLNNAIMQAEKLIDLSHLGKLHSTASNSLRADAWMALKKHLEELGVNTATAKLEILSNSKLDTLRQQNPALKAEIEQLFDRMSRALGAIQSIPSSQSPSSASNPPPASNPSPDSNPLPASNPSPDSNPLPPSNRVETTATESDARIRRGIAALLIMRPQLGRAMETILLDAETFAATSDKALLTARTNLENWFDATMDRTSGWYKRNVQLTLFVIGLVVAGSLNIDSLHVASTLWREPTIRQALVAQAEKYEPPPPNPNQDPAEAIRNLSVTLSQDLQLPIGWIEGTMPDDPKAGDWTLKGLGIILSAIAASFGAPFWFDVLDKVMNIRGAGKKPPKAEDQAQLPQATESK